jgi:hypothetical protein
VKPISTEPTKEYICHRCGRPVPPEKVHVEIVGVLDKGWQGAAWVLETPVVQLCPECYRELIEEGQSES